jgi:hypothetical protein
MSRHCAAIPIVVLLDGSIGLLYAAKFSSSTLALHDNHPPTRLPADVPMPPREVARKTLKRIK